MNREAPAGTGATPNASTATADTPSLTDIYDALDIGEDEHLSICHKGTDGVMRTEIHTRSSAADAVGNLSGDVWFGVNPVSIPVGTQGHRGAEADVTRLVALWTDLDVKPGCCPDLDTAHTIIDDLSALIGQRPVMVIFSGHGLQPVWAVEDCDPVTGKAMLHRWGRMVEHVASARNLKVDNVFDLTRILRVPGTLNCKEPIRVETSAVPGNGAPMTVAEIDERLTELGIHEMPNDRETLGDPVTDSTAWAYGGHWCEYAKVTTQGFAVDTPPNGRHPFMVGKMVRLAMMWRYGCIPDNAALDAVIETIRRRHAHMLATTEPNRLAGRFEIEDAWKWAVQHVSRMSGERFAAKLSELGNHLHTNSSRNSAAEDEANEWTADHACDPDRFFGKGVGLLALDLAEAVKPTVMCGFNDTTEQFYVYDHGVWRPDRKPLEEKIGELLRNRYRNTHARNALDLIRLSKDTPRLTCEPQPEFINARNGMVIWATGDLVPHSPAYLSTVQLPIEYDPTATCPAFDQFLAEVLPPDCIEFMWEIIGYTMYSGNPLHAAVLLYGKGRNGKGTLIRVLKRLLDEHNCSAVGLHELTDNRFRTATLYGKLANLAGDLDAKWISNTAAFKAITGGDLIQAEFKYGAAFDFTPWATPVYSANKAFGSADSSEGWVSRWTVVPFPNSFAGAADLGLDAKLGADRELRGVMARGIRALPALMRRGRFLEPASVREAKVAFVAAADVVRAWVHEHCTLDFDAWEPRTTLYRAYRTHTFGDGSKLLSAREFYNRVEQIGGIVAATRQGERGFRGIRLGVEGADSASEPAPEPAPETRWWDR